MGRFHHHADGTVHEHHDLGDHTGYTETGTERLMVLESILAENDRVAALNRADFGRAGVTTINLMSSPGAEKTTLLKRTISWLVAKNNRRFRFRGIERNDAWLKLRVAALNLRRQLALGLGFGVGRVSRST